MCSGVSRISSQAAARYFGSERNHKVPAAIAAERSATGSVTCHQRTVARHTTSGVMPAVDEGLGLASDRPAVTIESCRTPVDGEFVGIDGFNSSLLYSTSAQLRWPRTTSPISSDLVSTNNLDKYQDTKATSKSAAGIMNQPATSCAIRCANSGLPY